MIQAVLLSNDNYPCKKDREKRHREMRIGSTEMEAEEEWCSHKPRISWSHQKLEEVRKRFSSRASTGSTGPADILDLRFSACRTVNTFMLF